MQINEGLGLEALKVAHVLTRKPFSRDSTNTCQPRHRHCPLTAKADAIHGALMRRADALAGCSEGSDEEAELKTIVDLIEVYEAKRWPLGKEPGGKR
jgi:hypothetical protein